MDRAALHGCEALQIFTKSAGQWRARVLPDDEVRAFRRRLHETGIGPAVAHASYLINLAAPDAALWTRSVEALGEELDRAETLGLLGVVLHPGAAAGTDNDDVAHARVARGLLAVLRARPRRQARILLEHTAGQGSALGWRFEQIGEMLAHANGHARLGVCLDTCHLIAAGYDLTSDRGYRETMAAFGRHVGFDRLHVMHLNDSKRPLGSRVDRHTHIGDGAIGLAGFRRVLTDPRLAHLPMLLETPKMASGRIVAHDAWDAKNLETLRALCVARRDPAST